MDPVMHGHCYMALTGARPCVCAYVRAYSYTQWVRVTIRTARDGKEVGIAPVLTTVVRLSEVTPIPISLLADEDSPSWWLVRVPKRQGARAGQQA